MYIVNWDIWSYRLFQSWSIENFSINSNSNSWEILLTIAIAMVPKMSIAIVVSILLISSGLEICTVYLLQDLVCRLFDTGKRSSLRRLSLGFCIRHVLHQGHGSVAWPDEKFVRLHLQHAQNTWAIIQLSLLRYATNDKNQQAVGNKHRTYWNFTLKNHIDLGWASLDITICFGITLCIALLRNSYNNWSWVPFGAFLKT